jgi:hypothetical protein
MSDAERVLRYMFDAEHRARVDASNARLLDELERDEREQAEQTRIRRLMDDPVSALEERGWDAQDPAGVLAPGREAAYRARWGQR